MAMFLLDRPMGDLVETNICTLVNSNKILWWRGGEARSCWPTPTSCCSNLKQAFSNQTLKFAKFEYFRCWDSLGLTVTLVKKPCVDHCNRQKMPEKYHIPATGPDGKLTACKMCIQHVNSSHGSVVLLDDVWLINVAVLFFGLVPAAGFSQRLWSSIC